MYLDAALTAYFFAKELSPRSRIWYHEKLSAFIAWCDAHTCALHPTPAQQIESLATAHVREYLTALRTTPSVALNHGGTPPNSQTIHGYARAIRAWLNWCVREDFVSERVTRHLEMPKCEQKVIPVFTPEHLQALLAACGHHYRAPYTWLGERDKSITALLVDTGIRAAELCDLTLDRVRLDHEDAYIIVNGKGRKQRECPLGQKARRQLHRYMHKYRPATSTSS